MYKCIAALASQVVRYLPSVMSPIYTWRTGLNQSGLAVRLHVALNLDQDIHSL